MLTFSDLELSRPLLDAIGEEGYQTPTPIQAEAIRPILEGRDLLGCAQTGTGKTAAFALPILHRLHAALPDRSRRGPALPRALILAPTRELATQIAESFQTYGRHAGLSGAVIYGGVSQHRQVTKLRRGVDILVATPGRLMDLMEQGHVDLSRIEIFVLDEADRMLDMGFIQPIRQIAAELPEQRQTLLFSATMPPEIAKLAHTLLKDPVRVSVTPVASAAPRIAQHVFMVEQDDKLALLTEMLSDPSVRRALVFTKTKHGADKLTKKLAQTGVTAEAIHGNKSQGQRERALASFRSGRSRVLVATDVAARGLDVDGITHVFNFNLPMEPEAYIHRIGRTGRAGAEGIAVSLCAREERKLLRAIEQLTGMRLAPDGPDHSRPKSRKPRSDASRPAESGRSTSRPRREPATPDTGGGRRRTATNRARTPGPTASKRRRGGRTTRRDR